MARRQSAAGANDRLEKTIVSERGRGLFNHGRDGCVLCRSLVSTPAVDGVLKLMGWISRGATLAGEPSTREPWYQTFLVLQPPLLRKLLAAATTSGTSATRAATHQLVIATSAVSQRQVTNATRGGRTILDWTRRAPRASRWTAWTDLGATSAKETTSGTTATVPRHLVIWAHPAMHRCQD